MTIPWKMNCPHTDAGWCLDCVEKIGDELDALRRPSQDSQEVRVAIGDILTDVYHGQINPARAIDRILALSQSPKGAAGARECWVRWKTEVPYPSIFEAIPDKPHHMSGPGWEWVRMVETAGGESGPSAPKTGLRGADALGVVESVLAEMDRFSEKVLSGKVSDEEIGGMAPVIIDTWRTKLRAQGDAARGDAAAGWDSNQAAQALAARVQDLETRLLHAIEALDVFTAREFTGTILNRMKGWKGMNYLREPFEETTPEPAPGDVGEAGGDKA